MSQLSELGTGIVYFQGLEDFMASHASLIDVVETEPQTFWYDKNDAGDAFKFDREVTDYLRSCGKPLLFHGVGYPVGGTVFPPQAQFTTLKEQAEILQPQWVSEHLSFNYFYDKGAIANAGFLLQPLQTEEGVAVAAANIKNYQRQMGRPFAFETGVNYLKPRRGEMPDGLFARKVAEVADCHILLDLHNILTNQRNGRQSVQEFLEWLPFERAIELHVGGGMYYKDYYLDAHSGVSDDELLQILESVVKKLPNLKALMFEIEPDSLHKLPPAKLTRQLTEMKRIWDKRGYEYRKQPVKPALADQQNEKITVAEWEHALGQLILDKKPDNSLAEKLETDKGIDIIRDLVFNFRGSVLVTALKLSTRLLRLSAGEEIFNYCVKDFFASVNPELMPVIVTEQFRQYLQVATGVVKGLEKMLEYEIASIRTAIDKQKRVVSFDFDPFPVIAALQKAQMPVFTTQKVDLQVVFDPGAPITEALSFAPVFHN